MTDIKYPEVEVFEKAKAGRRRRFSAAEKRRLVEESNLPGMSVSEVARRYGVAPSLLFRWRKEMEEGALSGLEAGERVVPHSEVRQLQVKVRELERLLGRKTMECEILKEAIEIAREKKLLLRSSLPDEGDIR
jgi:transposase